MTPNFTCEDRDHLTLCYDPRSHKMSEIRDFIDSPIIARLQKAITGNTLIALGGDSLMIRAAKEAHIQNKFLLGVNFGTKGFLLHEKESLHNAPLEFDEVPYPILHTSVEIYDTTKKGTLKKKPSSVVRAHSMNEVFVRGAGRASSISLEVTHRDKILSSLKWDGLIVSTPVGSTGWSKSYDGIVLPHSANLLAFTPVGSYAPREVQPTVFQDKWRVRITNDTTRDNPLDVLVDNELIVSQESRTVRVTIERAARGVIFLIQKSYRTKWDNKPYEEIGFQTQTLPHV